MGLDVLENLPFTFLGIKVHHCRDDSFLFLPGQRIEEGKAQQPIAHPLGHGAVSWLTSKLVSHVREMQGQVMKDTQDPLFLQMPNHGLPSIQVWK